MKISYFFCVFQTILLFISQYFLFVNIEIKFYTISVVVALTIIYLITANTKKVKHKSTDLVIGYSIMINYLQILCLWILNFTNVKSIIILIVINIFIYALILSFLNNNSKEKIQYYTFIAILSSISTFFLYLFS